MAIIGVINNDADRLIKHYSPLLGKHDIHAGYVDRHSHYSPEDGIDYRRFWRGFAEEHGFSPQQLHDFARLGVETRRIVNDKIYIDVLHVVDGVGRGGMPHADIYFIDGMTHYGFLALDLLPKGKPVFINNDNEAMRDTAREQGLPVVDRNKTLLEIIEDAIREAKQ